MFVSLPTRRPTAPRSWRTSSGFRFQIRDPNPQDFRPGTGSAISSADLLGAPALTSCFARCLPEGRFWCRIARETDTSSGALPGWPRRLPEGVPHCRPAEIGSSGPSSSCELPRFWRLGRPPQSPLEHDSFIRVAKAESYRPSLWITGIWRISAEHIGNRPAASWLQAPERMHRIARRHVRSTSNPSL